MPPAQPSASYKFNTFQEIRSHSSILYNERMAILFYLLDMKSIEMNANRDVDNMIRTKSIAEEIYGNIRMLLRFNPTVRATLNLETKDPGIYITDVMLGTINRMTEFCEMNGYTYKRVTILIYEINRFKMLLKDVLQYFHYFIRPDFRQKPDVEVATEKYKEIADKTTIAELQAIVGKRHRIDFESLGSSRVEIQQSLGYDDEDDEVPIDDEDEKEEYRTDDRAAVPVEDQSEKA